MTIRCNQLAGAITLVLLAADALAAPVDPLAPAGRWTANASGSAPTPPMGWNSWNAFLTLVDEDKVMGTAQALVDSGLAKLGYRYVNIDDGWWLRRRQSDMRVQIRTKIFPSAALPDGETSFRPMTDRLHAMGLKAGIYSDMGYNSCSQAHDKGSPNLAEGSRAERQIGLRDHIAADMRQYFGDWGFDYIKVDACGLVDFGPGSEPVRHRDFGGVGPFIDRAAVNRSDVGGVRAMYRAARDAIVAVRPANDFVLSICAWGSANVRAWAKDIGNVSRTSDDILPTWTRMLHTFDSSASRALYAHPGTWNDPDMLFIGHGDFDVRHLTEARAHFAMWAVINAPLLIGYDMRKAPKALLDIWGNADLVRANQDPGGHQAVLAYDSADVQIFVKTLTGTDRKIVLVVNRTGVATDAVLLASHLKFAAAAPVTLRDLWSNATRAPFTGEVALTLAPHEAMAFEASGTRALADGMYLSELPGRINVAVDGVVTPQGDPLIHRGISPWKGTRSAGERPVYAGWGGAQADRAPWGHTLQIAATQYDSGIGILANSRMEVKTAGAFARFTAAVGVDANSLNTAAPLVFRVYGDGRLLATSKPVRFGDAPLPLAADIAGVQVVELVVRQATGAATPASATWADAALVRGPTPPRR